MGGGQTDRLKKMNTTSYCKASGLLRDKEHKRDPIESLAMGCREEK